MFRMLKRAPWIAVGAVAAWLFDGEKGAERRRTAKAKLESLTGRSRLRDPLDPDTVDESTPVRAA